MKALVKAKPEPGLSYEDVPMPVIGRIQDGAFILDLRCLENELAFVAQLATLAATR